MNFDDWKSTEPDSARWTRRSGERQPEAMTCCYCRSEILSGESITAYRDGRPDAAHKACVRQIEMRKKSA